MTVKAPPEKGTESAKAKPQAQTRLARLALPFLKPDSPLLPPDKWVLQTAWKGLKTQPLLRRLLWRTAGFAAAAVAAPVAAVGIAVLAPGVLIPVAAIATATAVCGLSALMVKKTINRIKADALPHLLDFLKAEYLEYKMSELKSAWVKRAPKKQEAAPPQAPAAPAPSPAPDATPQDITVKTDAPEKEKPQTLGGALGKWMLKKAMESSAAKKEKPAVDAPKTPPASPPQKPPAP